MSASATGHDASLEMAALCAIDALGDEERREFEAHVATCAECAAEVRRLRPLMVDLAVAVPLVDPPPRLRDAVLRGNRMAEIASRTDRSTLAAAPESSPAAARAASSHRAARLPRQVIGPPLLAAAAALVIAVGLGLYATSLRRQIVGLRADLRDLAVRLDRSERQLETATRALGSAQVRMAVLTAPDLARVDLAGQPPAPRASGRAFWSRTRGLVFAASALPSLPAGKVYQLWVVTAARPISAGLIQPDSDGSVTASFVTPPDIPPPVAMAVTLEPSGGVPAPTGDKYLVGSAGP